jgi:hypothetical protein
MSVVVSRNRGLRRKTRAVIQMRFDMLKKGIKNVSIPKEVRIMILRRRRGGKYFVGGSAKGNT